MVYLLNNTGALATVAAGEKWIRSLRIPQSFIHDRDNAFINTDLVNWMKEIGITLQPRKVHSPWTNGKIETQNQHIARCCRNFLNAGNNWSYLAPKPAFAHDTGFYKNTL